MVTTEVNREKISKADRLIKLRQILESYKKANQEPEVTELARFLKCTRQTLYYDDDYKVLLEEFEVGKRFKKRTIASEEYLLQRIDSLKEDIETKENTIKKLQRKVADLELINKDKECELARERKTTLRLQIYYLHLIETYNKTANRPINMEPFDLHRLEIDPLDLLLKQDSDIASLPNVTIFKNKKD